MALAGPSPYRLKVTLEVTVGAYRPARGRGRGSTPCLRRRNGEPPPWTADPILKNYRFCNINREHDTVTKWIRRNWRKPHAEDPYLWFAMVVARLFNLPESLEALGYPVPWDPERIRVLQARAAANVKIFNAAYKVGTAGRKIDKLEFLRDVVLGSLWAQRKSVTKHLEGATLVRAVGVFTEFDGLGGFLAGQVVADLKYTPVLYGAPDWWTWAISGPGSRRGMNRLLGRKADAEWQETSWLRELRALQRRMDPRLESASLPELCCMNWQNVLCEADKYWRTQAGEGTPKQRYP